MHGPRTMIVDRCWTRHARGRQPQVRPHELGDTARHLLGDLAVHRTGALQTALINPEHLGLDPRGVGHHAADDNGRRPRDTDEDRGDLAAREGLGDRHGQAATLGTGQEVPGRLDESDGLRNAIARAHHAAPSLGSVGSAVAVLSAVSDAPRRAMRQA